MPTSSKNKTNEIVDIVREMSTDGATTIYLADCLNALSLIERRSIDLIFADPPYNIGKKFGGFTDSWPSDELYADWCSSWLTMCLEKLKPDGSLYLMTS